MSQKTYKIRKFQNGRNKDGDPFINYSLTIPSHIAEHLPKDQIFACELTEEGILFRPVTPEQEAVELPSWAKQRNGAAKGGKGGGRKSSGPRKRPARKTTAKKD